MTDSTTEVLGNVVNPYSIQQADNTTVPLAQGRNSELLISEIHGKYFNAAARGALFSFNVTGVTVPVVASGLVSVCSLYNPIGSNRLLELVDIDISTVLATVVVDTWGLYVSSAVLTAKGTFTTAGTPQAGLLNSNIRGVGVPYSAYTHSGTPTRWMTVAMFGGVTTTTNQIAHYPFDGKAIITPGSVVSVATATAAANAAGSDINITWLETPIV